MDGHETMDRPLLPQAFVGWSSFPGTSSSSAGVGNVVKPICGSGTLDGLSALKSDVTAVFRPRKTAKSTRQSHGANSLRDGSSGKLLPR